MIDAIRTPEEAYQAGYAAGQRNQSVYPGFDELHIPKLANIVRPQERPAISVSVANNYMDGVADGYFNKPNKVQDHADAASS